jgi:hypothetical protein
LHALSEKELLYKAIDYQIENSCNYWASDALPLLKKYDDRLGMGYKGSLLQFYEQVRKTPLHERNNLILPPSDVLDTQQKSESKFAPRKPLILLPKILKVESEEEEEEETSNNLFSKISIIFFNILYFMLYLKFIFLNFLRCR